MSGGEAGRRTRAAAIVACVALALCGGGGALAASAPVAPGHPAAAATAINLRPGDLPAGAGWTTQKPSPAATLHRIDAQWSACYGGRYDNVLADVASDLFLGRADVSASSDVQIFSSAALAADDFTAFDRPRGSSCAKELIRRSFRSSHGLSATVDSLASTAVGTGATFALRISVAAGGRHYVFDETVFLEAQAEVTVSVVTGGTARTQAPPASLERSLTALVVGRSKQALG